MKDKFLIGEISEFFHISTASLRYWEETGIIHPASNNNSGYREYQLPDLMQISDILFYKSLGLKLKDIASMEQMEIETQWEVCQKQTREVDHQLAVLKQRISRLEQHQEALKEIQKLRQVPYLYEDNAMKYIVPFELTEISKLRSYIENPYLYSRVQYTQTLPDEQRGLHVENHPASGEAVLWERGAVQNKWITSLLKEEISEKFPNNLSQILEEVHKSYQTGAIISRFLAEGTENGVCYDYYKTYIEIKHQ